MKNLRVIHLMFLVATVALLLAGCHKGNGHDKPTPKPNAHVEAAIKETALAVFFGKQGNDDQLGIHATEALTHAKAAQQEMKNPHLDAAVKELEEAINHAKEQHVEVALSHAQNALEHLKQI
jgi:hypothetical protein